MPKKEKKKEIDNGKKDTAYASIAQEDMFYR